MQYKSSVVSVHGVHRWFELINKQVLSFPIAALRLVSCR